jgi:hypothetical protein
MFNDKTTSTDQMTAGLVMGTQSGEKAAATGFYTIQCFDAQGNLKWEAKSKNLVVNVGLQDMNAKYFTGSAYTAAWYIGLYGAGASNKCDSNGGRRVPDKQQHKERHNRYAVFGSRLWRTGRPFGS